MCPLPMHTATASLSAEGWQQLLTRVPGVAAVGKFPSCAVLCGRLGLGRLGADVPLPLVLLRLSRDICQRPVPNGMTLTKGKVLGRPTGCKACASALK